MSERVSKILASAEKKELDGLIGRAQAELADRRILQDVIEQGPVIKALENGVSDDNGRTGRSRLAPDSRIVSVETRASREVRTCHHSDFDHELFEKCGVRYECMPFKRSVLKWDQIEKRKRSFRVNGKQEDFAPNVGEIEAETIADA